MVELLHLIGKKLKRQLKNGTGELVVTHQAVELTDKVLGVLETHNQNLPSVEDIQDIG